MTFLMILAFVLGVITGIQTPLWVGIVLAGIVIFFLGSDYVKSQEIAGLIYVLLGVWFIIGMIAGDVYVFMAYPELRPDIPAWNPLVPPGANQ